MSRLRSLYPLLFVAFPVLGIAARNPGSYALGDLLSVLLTLLAAFGLLLAIARLGLRRVGPDVPPLVTFVAVLVFFFYPAAREWIDTLIDGTILDQARIVPTTLGVTLLLLVGWLAARRDRIGGATVGLTATGLLRARPPAPAATSTSSSWTPTPPPRCSESSTTSTTARSKTACGHSASPFRRRGATTTSP